jgi:valyl-tRNA synthetase
MKKRVIDDRMIKMDQKFLSPYNPESTEDRIYQLWLDSGYFDPDKCIADGITKSNAEPFAIVLPPPNVTGVLHMGHAAMLAIEDIIVRYHRMQGKRTLWIPGTDHAAIATQSKVEKLLEKEEKKSRHDLGRDEFLKRVEKFAQESHDTIVHQVRKMGASVDWSREAFTLDEKRSLAVRTAFKHMYEDGLIYRGYRVVNWDPKGQTVISDDELVHEERKAKLYTFKYSADFPITISTTRPETKVGDTAVAVHPEDERYKEYVGKEYDAVFCGVPIHIKIVADQSVEKDFGTGALGVTPAHSQIDWEIAQRHNLELRPVINEYAKMAVGDERLLSKKVGEAREVIVDWLRNENLLVSEEDVVQNVATAERTGGIIEPLPKLQWFLAVNKPFTLKRSHITGIPAGSEVTLKQLMQTVVTNKQIEILPERFDKTYFQWIDNLRDWCISRQIWYGHRVPVWYRSDPSDMGGQEIYCGITAPSGEDWAQDSDTLDTWFSSGLWTFSTLGWPDEDAPDLKAYHPTQLLETGYDILFFWVARMILMSTYHLGQIPFEKVYLHGLVRDAKGQKMSKSKGNIIDPLDMIAKYGADATRMSLIVGAGPGSDMNLSEDKIKGYKKFTNKIWNITRFILEASDGIDLSVRPPLDARDEAALKEFAEVREYVTEHIEAYKLHLVAEKLYHYTWNTLADVMIEERKSAVTTDPAKVTDVSKETRLSASWTLRFILEDLLKLLHPFIPYVTEEIWQSLPSTQVQKKRPLIVTAWTSL